MVQQLDRLDRLLESKNAEVWNPVGLNVLNPRKKAFLFVSRHQFSSAHLAR